MSVVVEWLNLAISESKHGKNTTRYKRRGKKEILPTIRKNPIDRFTGFNNFRRMAAFATKMMSTN